jgi:hypothetical protein
MTSVLLLAVGLGFPPGASAAAPQIAKVGATAVASVTATAPMQADAVVRGGSVEQGGRG